MGPRHYSQVHLRFAGFLKVKQRPALFIAGQLRIPGGSNGKEFVCSVGDLGSIPGSGRIPGEGMTTHSSILAWRSLTGYSPRGCRVGHD